MTINYIPEVGLLQHFLQLLKLSRAACGLWAVRCTGLFYAMLYDLLTVWTIGLFRHKNQYTTASERM